MTEIPSGSVIITPEDMWKSIEQIRDTGQATNSAVTELKLIIHPAVADIRKDITDLAASSEKATAELEKRERDHFTNLNTRIVDLEKTSWSSRWVPVFVSTVCVAALTGVLEYLIIHLPK